MTAAAPDIAAQVLAERASTRFDDMRVGPAPPPDRLSPIVLCVLKDEMMRVRDFLRHYREAGIERFAIIDNGSTDGTCEFLARQRDVDLYRKEGPFHWIKKQGWINKLIESYGYGRWYLCVDADELVVFDGLGDRCFQDFAELMERRGIRRARGFLLDMYSDAPLLKTTYGPGERMIEAFPYYDASGYVERKYKEIISIKGGPRARAFGLGEARFRPELTKYPLFTIAPHEAMVNPHHIWPLEENFVSPRVMAVLHFKFLPDLSARIKRAIALRNYWDESFEYRCYAEAIEADPETALIHAGSERYAHPDDLVANGLMSELDWDATRRSVLATRRAMRLRRAELLGRDAPPPASGEAPLVAPPPMAGPADEPEPALTLEDDAFVGFLAGPHGER